MIDVAGETTVTVALKMLDPELAPPSYATLGDAGADLRARHETVLEPGQRALVDTGVALAIPHGYVGWCTPDRVWRPSTD